MHILDNFSDEQLRENCYLGILANEDTMFNPLVRVPPEYEDTPELYLVQLMRSPEYFYFFIHYVLGLDMLPMHMSIVRDMWKRKFPIFLASRGYGKSFNMGLYALLRACMLPSRKVVIAGAGFRQSKIVFEYIEKLWEKSPILRSAYDLSVDGPKHGTDLWRFRFGTSEIMAIPIGTGNTIRGLRANDLFTDEFAAINAEIYEQVLVGFAAVSSDPINNVKEEAYKKFKQQYVEKVKKLGIPYSANVDAFGTEPNQIVISGTADYRWNHFFKYFDRYRKIIYTQGDLNKLKEVFGSDEIPEDFDWEKYAVYRIPIEIVPRGFMDAESLARSKATVTKEIYAMEYQTVFVKDTQGFYRRSLIESCVMKYGAEGLPTKEIFKTRLMGNPKKKYVMGIDVASEDDNLAIVIIELNENHRRIVYSWTTTRKKHSERVSAGLEKEDQFFSYVAKKINHLRAKFPVEAVGMDSQGGGIAVMEALKDERLLEEGQKKLLEEIDYKSPKPTDNMHGEHKLVLIQFANANWTSESNHGMKKDLEDRVMLFPFYDLTELELAFQEDQRKRKKLGILESPNAFEAFDTLEDAVEEIEKLKEELSIIVHSKTPSGRERWDTPEERIGNKSIRSMKKDRYSALLIANYLARGIQTTDTYEIASSEAGGAASHITGKEGGNLYGGGIIAEQLNGLYN